MSDIEMKATLAELQEREGKYPNLLGPDEPLGGLKRIERIEGIADRAPEIKWGRVFLSWPPHRQLHYAKRLASAQNHAAFVMQESRNAILAIATKQEAQIKQLKVAAARDTVMMQQQITAAEVEKQQLFTQIVDQKATIKKFAKRIQELEADLANFVTGLPKTG